MHCTNALHPLSLGYSVVYPCCSVLLRLRRCLVSHARLCARACVYTCTVMPLRRRIELCAATAPPPSLGAETLALGLGLSIVSSTLGAASPADFKSRRRARPCIRRALDARAGVMVAAAAAAFGERGECAAQAGVKSNMLWGASQIVSRRRTKCNNIKVNSPVDAAAFVVADAAAASTSTAVVASASTAAGSSSPSWTTATNDRRGAAVRGSLVAYHHSLVAKDVRGRSASNCEQESHAV